MVSFNPIASVEIIPTVSSDDIECPGDILSYNCSIQSNSERVQLTWRVTLPGDITLNLTFYAISNLTSLNGYIATAATSMSDEYIESILWVTLQPDILMDQITLECLTESLENATAFVNVNTSSE